MAEFYQRRRQSTIYPYSVLEDKEISEFILEEGLSAGAADRLLSMIAKNFHWERVTFRKFDDIQPVLDKVPLTVSFRVCFFFFF